MNKHRKQIMKVYAIEKSYSEYDEDGDYITTPFYSTKEKAIAALRERFEEYEEASFAEDGTHVHIEVDEDMEGETVCFAQVIEVDVI